MAWPQRRLGRAVRDATGGPSRIILTAWWWPYSDALGASTAMVAGRTGGIGGQCAGE